MAVWGMLMASMSMLAVAGILIWILTIVAYWRMFEKAGEAGWKSVIPVYATYKMYDIVWNKSMFWAALAAGLGSGILGLFVQSGVGMLAWMLAMVCAAAAGVINILFCVNMAKIYGHGGGFAAGLVFFNTIFILILGLGNSEYACSQG